MNDSILQLYSQVYYTFQALPTVGDVLFGALAGPFAPRRLPTYQHDWVVSFTGHRYHATAYQINRKEGSSSFDRLYYPGGWSAQVLARVMCLHSLVMDEIPYFPGIAHGGRSPFGVIAGPYAPRRLTAYLRRCFARQKFEILQFDSIGPDGGAAQSFSRLSHWGGCRCHPCTRLCRVIALRHVSSMNVFCFYRQTSYGSAGRTSLINYCNTSRGSTHAAYRAINVDQAHDNNHSI